MSQPESESEEKEMMMSDNVPAKPEELASLYSFPKMTNFDATLHIANEFRTESTNSLTRYVRKKWMRISWPDVTQTCCLIILAFVFWAIGYSLFNEAMSPTSEMVALATLFIAGKIVGVLVGLVKIPPMIGMLAVGVLFKNIGFIHLSEDYKAFAAILRQMALVNILLPAGLGLDPKALRKMSAMVLALSIIPPGVEVLVMALVSHFLLFLPWLWAILLGLLMGAVSPAVIIPCLFELQADGYGVNKGIHTLVIAASTLDDIACIAFFGIVIGVIFSTGSLMMQILEGPIVVVVGVTYGVLFGLLAQYIPHHKSNHLVTLRTLLIGGGSVLAAVGSQAIGYSGAGTLGCIVTAFVACLRWRQKGWDQKNPVKDNFSLLWQFFEPISFCLIGIEVDFSVLESNVVLWGTISMIIALIVRMSISVLITYRSDLNLKETFFVALTSVPKATVQAALGPVALDYANLVDSPELKNYANIMLIVSVLSIIVTSPIGAFIIMQTGPRFLHQTKDDSKIATIDNNIQIDMNHSTASKIIKKNTRSTYYNTI